MRSPWSKGTVVLGAMLAGALAATGAQQGCFFPDYVADLTGPDCTQNTGSVECVTRPTGWTGPVYPVFGREAGCAGDRVPGNTLYLSPLDASAPASCTACGCDASGASCILDDVRFYNGECAANCDAGLLQSGTTCKRFDATGCSGVRVKANVAEGCAPSGGVLEPLQYEREAVLCALRDAGLGCEAGESCAPPSGCYYIDGGDAPCFDSGFTPSVLYELHDDRSCTACTCSTKCSGMVIQNQNSCTNLDCDARPAASFLLEQCSSIKPDVGDYAFKYCPAPPDCMPRDGGEPNGIAEFNHPITLCCPR